MLTLFIQVDFWFDIHEGKPDAALLAKWAAEKAARSEASEYEDSEDGEGAQLDQARLRSIKQLLFDIYRIPTGEDQLVVPDFINALISHRKESSNAERYDDYIFS